MTTEITKFEVGKEYISNKRSYTVVKRTGKSITVIGGNLQGEKKCKVKVTTWGNANEYAWVPTENAEISADYFVGGAAPKPTMMILGTKGAKAIEIDNDEELTKERIEEAAAEVMNELKDNRKEKQSVNVFNNPHDSHVMQAAAGEIFTQTTKTNEIFVTVDEAIQKIEEAEPFVLTIEEPKAKSSKTGKARKNRSKKAIERVMDSVCENLFPEVTAVAISKPAKTKTINKKRRYSKKDTEKLMNSVCADLFEEFTKGLNLFAA